MTTPQILRSWYIRELVFSPNISLNASSSSLCLFTSSASPTVNYDKNHEVLHYHPSLGPSPDIRVCTANRRGLPPRACYIFASGSKRMPDGNLRWLRQRSCLRTIIPGIVHLPEQSQEDVCGGLWSLKSADRYLWTRRNFLWARLICVIGLGWGGVGGIVEDCLINA